MRLVTGGAGYIGSHFIKQYLGLYADETVIVLDNFSQGKQVVLAPFERVITVEGDVGDAQCLRQLFETYPIDGVIHFAGSCLVGESQDKPHLYFQNNVTNSLILLEAAVAHGVQQFLFSSTCATYGLPRYTPIDESHEQQPISVYGLTKLMVEQALSAYHRTHGLSYITLRYFNAAGADPDGILGESHYPESHLIPIVLKVAKGEADKVLIYGDNYDTPDGTCIRDYIHVSDLADAHCKAMAYLNEHPGIEEAVNLGSDQGTSVKKVIERCEVITGRPVAVEVAGRRSGDPPVLVADSTKAKNLFQWQPQFTLDQIIESAWHWEQNRRY